VADSSREGRKRRIDDLGRLRMSVSENIRSLAREGKSVADIARRLGISYQHAYNVLKASSMLTTARSAGSDPPSPEITSKPNLLAETLVDAGFEHSASWILSDVGDFALDRSVPVEPGVYAFSENGIVLYVGVATEGLSKRLYFYRKPGRTQLNNWRLNGLLRDTLISQRPVEIYTIRPPDLEYNGLPINGCVGLELGLIRNFMLPWNRRSAN
jgi:hypothetical protein